ncbi:hypothetical protein DCS_02913 [Drechmeria coniospora]|uniref:Zn(2)-C6 fungal-type domain-containing protein n=1 Tax=Drechmeria coniospora TaxID=98403 RepID=A0A151GXD6_DRECN|nr:hypothetical protein DCS_02913 [Drechmeria coniospora]KYK61769.1 hypothetical protein DCS_02913 [Drechmeria coniospora]
MSDEWFGNAANPTAMDPSPFDTFAFHFSPLPDEVQNPLMASSDPTHVACENPSNPSFSHHHPMDASLALSMSTLPPTLKTQPDRRRSSLCLSETDDGVPDSSPASNSQFDPLSDEFDLHDYRRADRIHLAGKKVDNSDVPPAWTELKTKAGKERKRLPLACIACRRKKIRCSGEKPTCKHCLRSRTVCVYKVTSRKPDRRPDHATLLDKRLKRNEESAIEAIPEADQDDPSTMACAVVKPSIPTSSAADESLPKKRREVEAFGPSSEAWAKVPCKSMVTGGQDEGSLPDDQQEDEERKLSDEGKEALPSEGVQEHLAEVFFDNLYGQAYHLLHKPTFMRKLNGRRAATENGGRSTAEPRDNMDAAAYTIRSIATWGRLVAHVNEEGRETDPHPIWSPESRYATLEQGIDDFVAGLPPRFQYSAKNLDLEVGEKTSHEGLEVPKDFLSRVRARTFTAANRVSDILRDAEESRCSVPAPFAGYCAFSSTAVHISNIFTGNPASRATAEANVDVNMRFLRKMIKFWGIFHWMVHDIRSRYRNAMSASRSGGAAGDDPTTSAMIQYSDWFDRYPHGLMDSDFSEMGMQTEEESGADGVADEQCNPLSVDEFSTIISPSHCLEGRDEHRMGASRKKQVYRKLNEVPTTCIGRRHSSGQVGVRPPPTRKSWSSSKRGLSNRPGPANFSPLAAKPQFPFQSPISPIQASHSLYPQGQLNRSHFLPNELPFVDVTRQPNGHAPSLHRQLSFDSLVMNPAGIPNTMDYDMDAWSGLPGKRGTGEGQQIKMEPDEHRSLRGAGDMVPGERDVFDGQNPGGWTVPFEMNNSAADQSMGIGGTILDPFNNIACGGLMMTPSQLDWKP